MIFAGKMAAADFNNKCVLRPYSKGCPDSMTPHHCVPDHCFREKGKGGARYSGAISHRQGLCVCVAGSSKSKSTSGESIKQEDFPSKTQWFNSLAEHGRVHSLFDAAENKLGATGDPANSAKLGDLESEAAKAVNQVTGCNEANLKQQMRDYHQDKKLGEDVKLRADAEGTKPSPPSSLLGSNTASGGASR